MSVVLNHSATALLSEKLPNTWGSSIIYCAEPFSLQVAGEKVYPSYQEQICPVTNVRCLLSDHTDFQIKSTPGFDLQSEFHELSLVKCLPRLTLSKERPLQRSQTPNLIKKKKKNPFLFLTVSCLRCAFQFTLLGSVDSARLSKEGIIWYNTTWVTEAGTTYV